MSKYIFFLNLTKFYVLLLFYQFASTFTRHLQQIAFLWRNICIYIQHQWLSLWNIVVLLHSYSPLLCSYNHDMTSSSSWSQCYKTFFSLLLMMRPHKLECLYLAITFQSSLTFAGSTRSLPKKITSERSSNWVSSGFALKFSDSTGKGYQGQTL